MTKKFKMEGLDCANCALKMEQLIGKIPGVRSASINFMMQKLTIDADEGDFAAIIPEAKKACKKVDSCCEILA